VPSPAAYSNQRWATDFTCVWTKHDGLIYVNEVIDCADRSVVGRGKLLGRASLDFHY